MQVTVVLGAGATLAQGQFARGNDFPGELPPLDGTFFAAARELNIRVAPELRQYGVELLGADPFSTTENVPRMEEFFKDVFYDFLRHSTPGAQTVAAYTELVRVYRRVITQTTEWLIRAGGNGPLRRLLIDASSADDVTIITFNHDLVIENELDRLKVKKSMRDRWCLRHGYGTFSDDREFTSASTAEMFEDQKTCVHERPIRLFKLHGSLNWYVLTPGDTPDAELLRGNRGKSKVQVTLRKFVPQQMRRAGEYTWPVVVPPVYAKQPFIENFMSAMWAEAHQAITECDRLVCFGYSMPALDIEAEKEFQRAGAQNKKLQQIDVINPDPFSASRYAGVFRDKSVSWYPTIDDFLSLVHASASSVVMLRV